jgi:hypothetical protein
VRAKWLVISGVAFALAVAACAPTLGERPELPTAVPGVVSAGGGDVTVALGRRFRGGASSGPTPTPAPWATPLPPTPRPGTPKIMHDLTGNQDCLGCHQGGRLRPLPDDHSKRTNEMCQGCHSVDYGAVLVKAEPIPHELAGREQCLQCHLLSLEGARPMPGEHTGRSVQTCSSCHKPL